MKQVIFLMLCVAINHHCFCQTDTMKRKTTINKATTITNPVTLQQPGTNTVVTKLPDLRITSVNVKQITNSTGGKYLEISYTVKNDGNAPVDLSNIGMSGTIKLSPTSVRDEPGCGKTITTLSGTLLNPGETHSNSYRCYVVMDFTVYKYYILSTDNSNAAKELNETNNSATTTILIQ